MSMAVVNDETFNEGADAGVSLGDWFSRPIIIARSNLTEGAAPSIENFYPWYSYFQHPTIAPKIKGFSRLRANLHIKVVVNASPYRYALGMLSYKPLVAANSGTLNDVEFSGGNIDSLSAYTNGEGGRIARSQRPHVFYTLSDSSGCEMSLPFIHHSNWLDLRGGVTSDAAKVALYQMGALTHELLTPLSTIAAASADPSTVTFYCWATDVSVAGASMNIEGGDDYAARPVSTIASAVAAATGALSAVPVIGPYMRASSMVASALGSVARWFGYSNPPVIEPVRNVRIGGLTNLASPEISTQIEKLSLDPKQEISIDPRTVGCAPIDELDLRYLCGKQSYLWQGDWYTYDAAATTILACHVTPDLYLATSRVKTNLTYAVHQATPVAHFSQFFKYWRGDLKFHFKIICTKFHRGRLRIFYDPAGPLGASGLVEGRLHTQVVDIAEATEIDFTVPYMATTPWLEIGHNTYTSTSAFPFSSRGAPGLPYSPKFMNGTLYVQVLNELGSLDSTSPIQILAFVSAADNFELACPTQLSAGSTKDITYIQPLELESADEPDPNSKTIVELPMQMHLSDKVASFTMGESVKSFRQLMHRSVPYVALAPTTATAGAYTTQYIFPRNLPPPGCVISADLGTTSFSFHETAAISSVVKRYNFVAMTAMHYAKCCFVGCRGSTVIRIKVDKMSNTATSEFISLGRTISPALHAPVSSSTGAYTPSALSKSWIVPQISGAAGMTVTGSHQGYIDAIFPHYSAFRMLPVAPYDTSVSTTVQRDYGMNSDNIELTVATNGNEPKYTRLYVFASAGVDFQVFGFLNVPTMYVYTSPTPSTTV